MSSEAESAVAAFFHASRAAAKRARRPTIEIDDRLRSIILERVRIEERAARDAYERSLG